MAATAGPTLERCAGIVIGLGQLIDWIDRLRQRRTEVHVRVHAAFFGGLPPAYYFVNISNASPEREVTVTHVWFETQPRKHILEPTRQLPARIAPRSQWETWIPVAQVPARPPEVFRLARVQLADERIVESIERESLPEVGFIPG